MLRNGRLTRLKIEAANRAIPSLRNGFEASGRLLFPRKFRMLCRGPAQPCECQIENDDNNRPDAEVEEPSPDRSARPFGQIQHEGQEVAHSAGMMADLPKVGNGWKTDIPRLLLLVFPIAAINCWRVISLIPHRTQGCFARGLQRFENAASD